jgi:hypothetical protein
MDQKNKIRKGKEKKERKKETFFLSSKERKKEVTFS